MKPFKSITLKSITLPVLALCLVFLLPASDLGWMAASPSENQPSQVQPQGEASLPTDQVILKYKTAIRLNELSAQALAWQEQRMSQVAGVQMDYLREMSGEAYVFKLTERLPLEQVNTISHNLMALPEVDYAEPDLIMQPLLVPNDTQYGNQWHYFTPSAGNYGINAPPAWDITTGASNIVAAVVDTGITNHAEFSGRTVAGYDFINDALVGNDGNARDNDPHDPGDWIADDENDPGDYFQGCPVTDSSWHGTHTAGTIGAASNNNSGVTGVNWTSKILPVRVLGKCGGYTSDVTDGMRWAAGLSVGGVPNNTNPAKVINVSLGGGGSCGATYQNAVNAIVAAGSTLVVSAGNSNANAGGFTPANCNGVITVAATDRDGSRAYYSNYGATVEISGPGGAQSFANDPDGVLSTLNTGTQGPVADTYIYYQGTSMSAPHVTGVVSLLYSLDPSLLPAQVLQILQDTVTHFPLSSTCNTSICGSGIVNAGAAVQKLSLDLTQTPSPTNTSTPTKTPTPTVTPTPTQVPPGFQYKLYVPLVIY